METLKSILFGTAFFLAVATQAQVSINVNLGSPPAWGPVGYSNVQYYYLPDVQAYYDINASMFIYQSGGVWIHRTYLPYQYRNYNLYGGYKVVLNDYHGSRPYNNYGQHCRMYAKGYHGQPQRNIGERPENGNRNGHYERQYQPKKQPTHSNGNNNGKGNGNNKSHNNGNDSKKGNDHGNSHGKK